MSETTHPANDSESVWVDMGDPDCDGAPRWVQDQTGKRTFTCPKCLLHWYYFIPGGVRP